MKWKKLKAIEPYHPCLNCPPKPQSLPMNAIVGVGFGYAAIECDGKPIWIERPKDKHYKRVWWAERKAYSDPDHDWRIVMHGPLHGESWQRQGDKQWVCVERNMGFA
jgi:hypothetical protein